MSAVMVPHRPMDYGGVIPSLNSDCVISVFLSLLTPRHSRLITEARLTLTSLINLRGVSRKSRHLIEAGIPNAAYLAHFCWFIAQRSYPLNTKIALLGAPSVRFQNIIDTVRAELFHTCHYCGHRPAPVYPKFTRRICQGCYMKKIITQDCVKARYDLNERQVSRLRYMIPFTTMELQIMRLQRHTAFLGFRSSIDTLLDTFTIVLFIRDDVEGNLFRL